MNDFNETDATTSTFEERTSSMSDYSTSITPDETRYRDSDQIITPEIVHAGSGLTTLDAGDNPIVLLAEKLPEPEERHLSDDECAFTREEAEKLTQDLQLKYHAAVEAQYDLIVAVRKAHDGHIWRALGYPKGAAGWKAYCNDYFQSSAIKLTREQRDNLILGLVEPKSDGTMVISNRDIAVLLGVGRMTVGRVIAKAEIAPAEGKVRSADGKLRHASKGMSNKERQERIVEIVELSEQGMKQNDIAKTVGVTQSTVSDTLRKDRIRRWSDGLDPAALDDESFDTVDDDQPLAIDMGDADDKARSYIEAFDAMARDAAGALESLVEKLESEHWQPGSATVDEIIARDADTIFTVMDLMGKFLRLLNIDAETVFGDMEDEHGKWARFIDGTDELGTVCAEIVD